MKQRISVIILAFNEQLHIERCIRNAQMYAEQVFVVDCYSTDDTADIARRLGAHVVQREWVNHADQLNWALENLPLETEWVMRLDADEYATEELAAELRERLGDLPSEVTGIALRRRVVFMGRWIRHGTMYSARLLRVWRRGQAVCESRWMDEHMQLLAGRSLIFSHDIVDENLNDLTWWTEKHNRYATREAMELIAQINGHGATEPLASNPHTVRKRWMKDNFYYRLPSFGRAAAYFLYRYLLRGGFLDGTPGLIFHTLQGFWYRFLVDAKVREHTMRQRQKQPD